MKLQLIAKDIIAIGIDEGGPKKGFHAVALRGGRSWDRHTAAEASSVVDWCLAKEARAIGIDAPMTGKARKASAVLPEKEYTPLPRHLGRRPKPVPSMAG